MENTKDGLYIVSLSIEYVVEGEAQLILCNKAEVSDDLWHD